MAKREVEVAPRTPASSSSSTRPSTRTACWSRLPAAGLHAKEAGGRLIPMRSLLFVPGDSPQKLEKAMASGADALIVDLEDSVAADRKALRAANALAFLRECARRGAPAAPLRPHQRLRHGLDRGRPRRRDDGRPDGIVLPKAEGGARSCSSLPRLRRARGAARLPDGSTRILAIATETPAALFRRHLCRRERAARWAGLGRRGSCRRRSARTRSRDADGDWTEPFRLARNLCLFGAAARAFRRSTRSLPISAMRRCGARREAAARDGFAGKLAIHPAQSGHQRGLHAGPPADRAGAALIVAAFAAAPARAWSELDGVMFDRPHLLRAERVLACRRSDCHLLP